MTGGAYLYPDYRGAVLEGAMPSVLRTRTGSALEPPNFEYKHPLADDGGVDWNGIVHALNAAQEAIGRTAEDEKPKVSTNCNTVRDRPRQT